MYRCETENDRFSDIQNTIEFWNSQIHPHFSNEKKNATIDKTDSNKSSNAESQKNWKYWNSAFQSNSE